ncbi:MAG: insulinase family protein [Eggerthellaceae bacterium]|nr:insulinase family protein [Eggerthellaceae bacterium]
MELAPGTTLHGFAIDKREDLPEIEGAAYIGRHEESGARLLYLANDDNNKSFAIGFRTPPQDDTGVFHILEHSVLCGSRRFPVKEPFVDLLKGSMQTFLNAMTFPDKTLYPVASTNERDLFNLMDVYLDAVFHPQIYTKKAIFEQEGWHYELVANDGEGDPAALGADETTLVHNGVVFNEMKGALSDASSVLYNEVQAALFPGTCYAFESGGTPQAIPTLTYEAYLDEHRRHYRTDNSYIILYGNLDIDRALEFLDECYLVPVAAEQRELDEERAAAGLEPLRPRPITAAEGSIPGDVLVTTPQLCERCGGSANDVVTVRVPADSEHAALHPEAVPCAPYVRRTMDTAPENACAACGYVLGGAADRTRATATEILLDALFGSNEAPLKRALLDEGVAHNVSAFLSDSILQPFVMVQAQMPAEGTGENLQEIIAAKVRDLLDAGLDMQLVEAALSNAEFHMREHDTGTADGVVYAITSLASWLYDDDAPIDYLRYETMFATLRSELEGDYFEQLCRELFCDNAHTASAEIVPTPGESDDDSAERLAAMNSALSPEERNRIVAEEALLRELQEAPDSPEAIATLPRLSVADIGTVPDEPAYGLDEKAPVPCIRHEVPTRGIAYAYRCFDIDCLSFDELPYLGVLTRVLGKLDTARRTAAELDTLTQGKLGNLTFFIDAYDRIDDVNAAIPKFMVSASALSKNRTWLADLPREVLLETDFSDTGRILDILKQRKIALERGFANSGHSCAAVRVKSYYTRSGVVHEHVGNVDYYRFLCDLIEHFDERAGELSERLSDIAERLFCDDNCTMSFAGSDDDYEAFWKSQPTCGRVGSGEKRLVIPEPTVRNEAFIVPSDVCFASIGWDRRLLGIPYDGSWAVAGRALSLDYLWNEVRVKGGAYGVGFQALDAGNMRFYTYRDPHLDESLDRIAKSAGWLASYDPSPEDMDGFVVASVAQLDAPIKPRTLVRRQMGDFFRGRKPEDRLAARDQAIATDAEAVRAFADIVSMTVDAHAMCAFGNRDILEASKAGFEVIPLVG